MSEFVEVLKRARSPSGDLFVSKHIADQLFRYIEITERQIASGQEAIELLKQVMKMAGEVENSTVTDFVRKITLRGLEGPL